MEDLDGAIIEYWAFFVCITDLKLTNGLLRQLLWCLISVWASSWDYENVVNSVLKVFGPSQFGPWPLVNSDPDHWSFRTFFLLANSDLFFWLIRTFLDLFLWLIRTFLDFFPLANSDLSRPFPLANSDLFLWLIRTLRIHYAGMSVTILYDSSFLGMKRITHK